MALTAAPVSEVVTNPGSAIQFECLFVTLTSPLRAFLTSDLHHSTHRLHTTVAWHISLRSERDSLRSIDGVATYRDACPGSLKSCLLLLLSSCTFRTVLDKVQHLVQSFVLRSSCMPLFLSGEHTLCSSQFEQALKAASFSCVKSDRQQSLERTDLQLKLQRRMTTLKFTALMKCLYNLEQVMPQQQLKK